jgi:hypothetical protein
MRLESEIGNRSSFSKDRGTVKASWPIRVRQRILANAQGLSPHNPAGSLSHLGTRSVKTPSSRFSQGRQPEAHASEETIAIGREAAQAASYLRTSKPPFEHESLPSNVRASLRAQEAIGGHQSLTLKGCGTGSSFCHSKTGRERAIRYGLSHSKLFCCDLALNLDRRRRDGTKGLQKLPLCATNRSVPTIPEATGQWNAR